MPLHDYFCQTCGQVSVDVYRSVVEGAQATPPTHCDRPMAWIPQVGAMDAYEPFQEFETRDGQNRPVLVDSLHKLRQVEEQSQRDYRNQEGQPLVWRRYSNDRSNHDVHALHPGWQGGAQPDPAFVKKHAASIKRSGADEPNVDYGPGVSDATPSALDHLAKE